MKWFNSGKPAKPEIHYRVVEIEKSRPIEVSPSELASLKGHPGFQYLCKKLALQKANLRAELETSRNENNQDVYLKSGIFWCGWLQSQVSFADAQVQRQRTATNEETELFNQILSTIDRVGHNPSDESQV